MAQLSIDGISSNVLNATQTIFNELAQDRKALIEIRKELIEVRKELTVERNASIEVRKILTEERKERDSLLDRIKCLETEKQAYLQKRDVENMFDCCTIQESTNQRKRIKTEFENENSMNYDTSKDELNAAFHSTSIEDDIVEPTQCDPYHSVSNKSKRTSPTNKSHGSNEQNKENQNKSNWKANEKSPTVLNKNSKKIEMKVPHIGNESPKWRSKLSTKPNAVRRIFENCSTQKEAPSESKTPTSSNTRKRVSLPLGSNTTRLKQSTLNFPRYEDETYCEGISCQIEDDKSGMNKNSSAEKIHCRLNSLEIPTQYNSKSKTEAGNITNDDSIAFVKCSNEIITIEESQPTQELFKHILDIKEELGNHTSPEPVISTKKVKNVADVQKSNLNCADCEEYHRILGRDLKKDFPKKFGVCSKHRRNIQCIETPPGFWNPKIVDSDSDHENTLCERANH